MINNMIINHLQILCGLDKKHNKFKLVNLIIVFEIHKHFSKKNSLYTSLNI